MTEHDIRNIQVPLNDFIREIARESAREAVREHMRECPIADVRMRVEKLEQWKAWTLGAMCGSGALGGGIGASIVAWFKG